MKRERLSTNVHDIFLLKRGTRGGLHVYQRRYTLFTGNSKLLRAPLTHALHSRTTATKRGATTTT